MVGWNERLQHVTNLQRANEWIYSQPTVSELITAATEKHRERHLGRRVAGDTLGTWGRCLAPFVPAVSPGAAKSPPALPLSCCLQELVWVR